MTSENGDRSGDAPARRPGLSYRFTHAIVRVPGDSVLQGLRGIDRGPPSPEIFRREHRAYIAALEDAGLRVEPLPHLEAYPDSVFVEDAALCLREGAVVLRPGAATRVGEAAIMEPVLTSYFDDVRRIDDNASVDGGDILVTDSVVLVGLSQRTNRAGFESLRRHLSDWDYEVRCIDIPPAVLHLKSDCAVLDETTVLVSSSLADHESFARFRRLVVPEGEEAAANAIRVNDRVLLPDGFPRTAELLSTAGYDLRTLANTQASKLDGGLSCMSLRFARPA